MSGTYGSVPASASSAPQASASTSSAPAPDAPFDDGTFVYHIDILIICIFAAFLLFALPRAAVRVTHGSEWGVGAFLRTGTSGVRRSLPRQTPQQTTLANPPPVHHQVAERTFADKSFLDTDAGHSAYASRIDISHNRSDASNVNLVSNAVEISGTRPSAFYYPPAHMPGWETYFPRIASLMRYTLSPGLVLGQAIILLGYFGIMLYAGLYKSNPFTDPVRAGYVAMSQIPIIIILATKNNVVATLLGVAYDTLNYIHRFAGLVFVLAANIHAIAYFYSWTAKGVFAQRIAIPSMQAALASLIAADLLTVLSTSFWRRRFYQLFIASHVISVISLLVAICYHTPDAIPYVIASVVGYGLDRLLRILKTRYSGARLTALKELKMTMIEIPNVTAGWKAGQHVRIRVASTGMGYLRWAENHPFTIASVSKGLNGEGLVLMCKNTGRWTNRLYKLASETQRGEYGNAGNDVNVLVEGPYGGPGHLMFPSFSGALLIAGGSGITFALGIVQDLIQKDLDGNSRVKTIEIVWAIQDPLSIIPLLPLLRELLSYQIFASLHISVFYTRAPSSDDVLDHLAEVSAPAKLTLSPGRPPLSQKLLNLVDRTCMSSEKRDARTMYGIQDELSGVIVGVCGPSGLAEQVRQVVSDIDPKRRKDVGGVELHEEAFGC